MHLCVHTAGVQCGGVRSEGRRSSRKAERFRKGDAPQEKRRRGKQAPPAESRPEPRPSVPAAGSWRKRNREPQKRVAAPVGGYRQNSSSSHSSRTVLNSPRRLLMSRPGRTASRGSTGCKQRPAPFSWCHSAIDRNCVLNVCWLLPASF
jgi:hypothetical protein